MSRRFGRNQKRRMRAQMTELQQQVEELRMAQEMNEGLQDEMWRRNSALEEILEHCRDVLGNDVALPPQQSNERITPDSSGRFLIERQPPMVGLGDCPLSGMTIDMVTRVMWTLMADVEDQRNRDGCVHLYVRLADETVAYTIAEEALARLSEDQLEKTIVVQMARALSIQLRNCFAPPGVVSEGRRHA